MENSLALALLVVAVALGLWLVGERRMRRKIEDALPDMLEEAAEEAVTDHRKRSGRTRVGNAVQHFAPFLEAFEYDPCDARFISGGPIDFVVFDGLTEGHVREIVFLDVKTGTARLNADQRKVRDCLHERRVSFATFELESARVARLKRANVSRG